MKMKYRVCHLILLFLSKYQKMFQIKIKMEHIPHTIYTLKLTFTGPLPIHVKKKINYIMLCSSIIKLLFETFFNIYFQKINEIF